MSILLISLPAMGRVIIMARFRMVKYSVKVAFGTPK